MTDSRSDELLARMFVEPPQKPQLSDCMFYHSFDFSGSPMIGEWDMRGRFADYTGDVNFSGAIVLDLGTASGFLSFEAERRGARVVSFDASDTSAYTRLPHYRGRYAKDPDQAIRDDNKWLERVKNSYWYAYHEFRSKNLVHYGSLYNLPFFKRAFDITLLGQFIVHNRSGIDVLMAAAETTRQYLVITEGFVNVELPMGNFIGRADRPDDYFSNWTYTPSFFKEIGSILGFDCVHSAVGRFKCNHGAHPEEIELATFVLKRRMED